MTRFKGIALAALAAGVWTLSTGAHAGKTLEGIKQRGQVICGVNPGLAGFGAADSQGNWTGLDVDIWMPKSAMPGSCPIWSTSVPECPIE